MGFLKEFKEFAVKGNVMDMAVGVIIGGAFGKIVTSVVNDIIMPPVGLLVGGVDFSDMKLTLKQAVLDAAGAVVTPAVCVFLMVKLMNRLTKKPAPAPAPAPAPEPPKPSNEEVLLAEIRDLLKEKK